MIGTAPWCGVHWPCGVTVNMLGVYMPVVLVSQAVADSNPVGAVKFFFCLPLVCSPQFSSLLLLLGALAISSRPILFRQHEQHCLGVSNMFCRPCGVVVTSLVYIGPQNHISRVNTGLIPARPLKFIFEVSGERLRVHHYSGQMSPGLLPTQWHFTFLLCPPELNSAEAVMGGSGEMVVWRSQ